MCVCVCVCFFLGGGGGGKHVGLGLCNVHDERKPVNGFQKRKEERT